MPRNKATVVSPDRIRLRLIQQVPAGTPGAFQDATFGFWWITTASRGLNGSGGFVQVEHASTLNDSSEMTVQLPPSGSDGRDNRDRLYLFNGSADPQGTGTVAYMPGDEWVELIRGVNEVVQVATPVSETSTPESLSIVCRDATAVLKKTRETAAGFWNHAPRDVFEHYTRAWQTVLAEDFQNTAAFPTLNSTTPQASTDGRWNYQGVSNAGNGLMTLTIPPGVTRAGIFQTSPLLTDAGPTEHRCWRVECSIASTSFTGTGPAIFLAVGYPTFFGDGLTYAFSIGPGIGNVRVQTANQGAYTRGSPPVSVTGYNDSWPVNAAGLLDSQNHLQPPYVMAIEARERWVYFYLDGQLVGVTPRVYPDVTNTATTGLVATLILAGPSGNTMQVDYVVIRKTTPAMNGGQPGDYRLPSAPSSGGLQGAYYDLTLSYGGLGTTTGGAQITQYNAAPSTFTPSSVRTDSGVYFQDAGIYLALPGISGTLQPQAPTFPHYTAGMIVYYNVTAVNAVGETTVSAFSFTVTEDATLTLLINPVTGATAYKVYCATNVGSTRQGVSGAGPGAEKYLATISSPDGAGNWTYHDDVTVATTGVSPPTTNTALAATSLSLGWFPAALGAAQQAYVRWTGAIYLPLGAGTAVTFKLPSTNISQALWVGRTRKGESICCSDSGDLVSQLGAGVLQTDFPGETIRQTSSDVRAELGSVSGWYPLVFEFIWRSADTATHTVGFTYSTGTGANVVPSPYVLSPYGCFTDQVAQSDSHFDVIQTTIGQNFAYKWTCQPKPLEDPGFPGIIVPKVRVGRDTDYVLDDTIAVNPQETSKAEDNATTDLAQAQGLGGSNSGGLTAEAFNFAVMGSHPFVLTESESLPATTQMGLLVLQMETLLALRSDAWQSVTADSSGQRSMQDSWPLTGALAEFDWGPGDGLRIELPSIGVVDATPRQIMALKRMFYQDGVGTNTAAFQDRPRDFAHTMRRFVRQFYSSRRQFQGQLTYVPGTQAVSPAYSMAPMPADTTLVRQATLTILSKSDTSTTFAVEVNGFATGQTVLAPGVLDISNAIGRNAGVEPQMIVRLTSPSADCQVSYILSLLVLVNSV